MKRVILIALFIYTLLCRQVFAADWKIDCDGKDCTDPPPHPLFTQTDQWVPGMWEAKIVTVKNLDDKKSLEVSTKTENLQVDPSSCHFDEQLILSINRLDSLDKNTVVWSGSVNDLFNRRDPISLGVFPPKTDADFRYIISYNQEAVAEENCPNPTTSFSLQLNFSRKEINNQPEIGAYKVTSAKCDDQAPKSPPTLINIIPGIKSVALFWEKAQDPVTYYMIQYGTQPSKYEFNNPNAGGKDTTEYIINGLDSEKQYFFSVTAGNGCAVGLQSNQLTAVTLKEIRVSPTQINNSSNVLGAATYNLASTPTPTITILGITKKNAYWFIALLQFAALAVLWL